MARWSHHDGGPQWRPPGRRGGQIQGNVIATAGTSGTGQIGARGMTRPRRAGTAIDPKVNTRSRSARTRAFARGVALRVESTPFGVLWSRLLEIEFVDRSVALAAKLFVSFFPLLIVAAAVARLGVHDALVAVVMGPPRGQRSCA